MEKTRRTTGPTFHIASVALVLASLTACTGPADSGDVLGGGASSTSTVTPRVTPAPEPSATAGSTPEPTALALSAIEPGAPLDLAELKDWTDGIGAEMQAGAADSLQGSGGHLDASTSQNRRDSVLDLPAGNYSYQFACRGGGTVTFAITSGGVESPVLSGACTGTVQGGDFAAADGGTDFRITALGDPIDFVFRYGAPLAR